MSDELKPLPCPFCGVNPDWRETTTLGNGWTLHCGRLSCKTGTETIPCETPDEAVAIWNRRADSDRIAGLEVGNFRLSRSRDGMLWLEEASGEGMEVNEEAFAKALAQFYKDNF